jgi:isopenicillin-N epimerase
LTNPVWGDGWPAVRDRWNLDPAMTHLNHGSFGAVPVVVQQAQEELRRRADRDPDAWFATVTEDVARSRIEIAGFLRSEPGNLALVHNVSAGVSTVLANLALSPGDEVLRSDHSYGAVAFAVERTCTRSGATAVIAEIPRLAEAEEIVQKVSALLNENTRLLVVDQVTSGARLFPVAELVATAHAAGVPILVDGAHALGMLDIDLELLGADFWVGNLHKWACAPRGTAALWVAPPHHDTMATLVVSWGEHDGFPAMFDRLGTIDLTPWVAAPQSLGVLDSLGWARLRRHNAELVALGQATIASALGCPQQQLVTDDGLSMAMVPLPAGVAATDSAAAALRQRIIAELHTWVGLGSRNGRGFLRISAQAYNHPGEFERLASGLQDLLSS